MQPIPDNIIKFLHANHVISIAAAADGEIWSACCFYVPDEAQARLIVLTSARSKHGSLMLKNPNIAGTIAGQPENIAKINGIQLTANAQLLTDETERKAALALYYKAHPLPRDESDDWSFASGKREIYGQQTGFRPKNPWQREAQNA